MRIDPAVHLNQPVRQFVRKTETVVHRNMTVSQATVLLRSRQINERVVYFYVVDEEGRLCGILPARGLILAAPDQQIGSIMNSPPIACEGDRPLRQALAMFAKHRFLALPVVDHEQRLLGVIDLDLYSEEAVDRAVAEREADVFQLIGVWMEQYQSGGIFKAYRLRMPWLMCNIIGGMVCAAIATWFGRHLAAIAVIASFIPLVLALCESVAIQSLTLSLQRIHLGPLSWRIFARLSQREARTAFLLALTCAIVVGFTSLLWGQGYHAPLIIAISILVAMGIAALVGTIMPLMLRLLQLDPRVAAGPVVLMCVDVCAMLVYLGLSSLVLR